MAIILLEILIIQQHWTDSLCWKGRCYKNGSLDKKIRHRYPIELGILYIVWIESSPDRFSQKKWNPPINKIYKAGNKYLSGLGVFSIQYPINNQQFHPISSYIRVHPSINFTGCKITWQHRSRIPQTALCVQFIYYIFPST